MLTYILPVYIFISLYFTFFISIDYQKSYFKIITIFGSALISFLIYQLSTLFQDHKDYVLIVFFLLSIIVFIIVIFRSKNIDSKGFTMIFYLVVLFIVFFPLKGCYKGDLITKNIVENELNKIKIYKSYYDFNVDSLFEGNKELNYDYKNKIGFPIIIFTQDFKEYKFDVYLNESLPNNLKTFNYDSIKTIVVLKKRVKDVGFYSNVNVSALQVNTDIIFIDKKTLTISKNRLINGEVPPKTVKFSTREKIPLFIEGSPPSFNEILNVIQEEIKDNE